MEERVLIPHASFQEYMLNFFLECHVLVEVETQILDGAT